MPVEIRWMIRSDLEEMLRIEQRSFPLPWTEEDFISCLKQRNCIGKVAMRDGQMAGYIIYEICKHEFHVLNFAVHPVFRGEYIGSEMIENLFDKLHSRGKKSISLEVNERNIGAQLFLKARGFRCVGIIRDYYDIDGEDAFRFRRTIGNEEESFEVFQDHSGAIL